MCVSPIPEAFFEKKEGTGGESMIDERQRQRPEAETPVRLKDARSPLVMLLVLLLDADCYVGGSPGRRMVGREAIVLARPEGRSPRIERRRWPHRMVNPRTSNFLLGLFLG